MSDDTPTERFDPKSNGVTPPDPLGATPQEYPPTRKLPTTPAQPTVQPVAGATPPPAPPAPPAKKSRTALRWLIGIGAALLVAVIVLLVILFGGDPEPEPTATATPTATAQPTPTPSPSPTEEPEPTPTVEPVASPTFDSFEAPTTADCEEGDDDAPLTFSWSSSNAERAFIGVQTTDAKLAPYASDLPPVFTYTDLAYQCDQESQIYTVTLEDAAGSTKSETVTITR
ncbi:hypothetical protein HD599_001871 [Conyzicola lurida]|uniref:Uncharacterized protein n=1 Tax=Conyzicola lurida TaxID=1172621 RepID=A0A841AMJ4_9MICO|nr:hypothetical protein [Conyzicola lurida]MBB5843548.1 hypothetical protein [Conyzicola lurida]